MTRTPYPPVGAVLALWDSPSEWFADVRILKRLDRGDVLLRVVRSAERAMTGTAEAKLLRSGRWILRGRARGPLIRAMYEGRTQSIAVRADPDDLFEQEEESLPGYFRNDEYGRAIISTAKSGEELRQARKRSSRSTRNIATPAVPALPQPSLNR